MKRKALVIDFYNNWVYHLGTSMEIIHNLINDHDCEVIHLTSEKAFTYSDIKIDNSFKSWIKDEVSFQRKNNAVKILQKEFLNNYYNIGLKKSQLRFGNHPAFNEINKLNKNNWWEYYYQNFDAGLAIKSSIVSSTRDINIEFEKNEVRIKTMLKESVLLYDYISELINTEKIEKVFLFNGRFSMLKACLRAAQKEAVDIRIHERGSTVDKYMLYKNNLPHSIKNTETLIEEYWKNGDSKRRNINSKQFYESRKNGEILNWKSFVNGQNRELSIPNYNIEDFNISIFTSSEDEFVSIGEEWSDNLFPTQIDGIDYLAEWYSHNRSNFKIYIRIHPNVAGSGEKYKKELRKQIDKLKDDYPFLIFIDPDDKISSYKLLEYSDIVFTFGSTMGIEAAYWGKPVVVLSSCFYRNLGSTYSPRSLDELNKTLRQDLVSLDNEGAKKYGYYLRTFGTKFKVFEPEGLFSGSYKGNDLRLRKIDFVKGLFKR